MSDATDRRSLLQNALTAIDELQAKLDQVESARREPIAIVGLGCRFPAGANSPDEYWDLLHSGRDGITAFPQDRLDMMAGAFDLAALGDRHEWHGGFLDRIDGFDPKVFGISPREANAVDPQQRLVLEVSWEALEHAAIAPDSLAGTSTGVFVGISTNDFAQLAKTGEPDVYAATGGALSAAAGRLSYVLGLQGPCMAIDTACSSSLVAVHQACSSLRNGESDLAIAGGVNVLFLEPEVYICFKQWGMMAGDGRCKTFDAAADGYVRSEGCGMLVLKRLSDAVAADDPILAVIRGSAVNQDGASSGFTVPNGPAQQTLLRRAYRSAGIAPADVQYFEAHGTGTAIGDPIEVEALGAVLGRDRPTDRPLIIGSAKSNIGHLEAAAGVAALIKVVLAMQHGVVPPNLHLHEPNPRIPWPSFPLTIPTEPTPWDPVAGRRVAGVSGFGFSGTNAHVVLESAPVRDRAPGTQVTPRAARLLGLSAGSPAAVSDAAGRLADHLGTHPEITLADVALSTAIGRATLPHRAGVVAADVVEARQRLAELATTGEGPGVVTGRAGRPRVGFLFTGQGSQYAGMGRGLYETEPAFRDAVDRCAELLGPIDVSAVPEWTGARSVGLLDVVLAPQGDPLGGLLAETSVTQPALFALQVALAELWASWGIRPAVVAGHSVGEFAAAVVAGMMSPADGLQLVAARGRLMQALPRGGAMCAIFAPHHAVGEVLAGGHGPTGSGRAASIAAVNSPGHTVVSGDAAAVAAVRRHFAERGVRVHDLVVSHAFHSPLMEPMLDSFAAVAGSLSYRTPHTPLVTNVGGVLADAATATADHWVGHVLAPVDFAAGVATMLAEGVDTFVELGPHPVLLAMASESGGSTDAAWLASLRRGRDDREQILSSAGALFTRGADVDLAAIAGAAGRRVALPTYPFERRRYWLSAAPARRRATGGHPLVGDATPAPTLAATIHDATIAADSPAWLADHRLFDAAVFPASGFAEIVLAASARSTIESLDILEPLVLDDAGAHLQTVVVTDARGGQDVQVVTLDGDSDRPTVHVHARAHVPPPTVDAAVVAPLDIASIAAEHPIDMPVEPYYDSLAALGLPYGPTFRGLVRLARGAETAAGLVQLPADATAAGAGYLLHPAVLDACFHVIGAARTGQDDGDDRADDDTIFVPFAIEQLQLHRPGATTVWCIASVTADVDGQAASTSVVSARLALYDEHGEPVATIERLALRRASRAAIRRAMVHDDLVYELSWRPQPLDQAPSGDGKRWLILADRGGLGADLAQRLASTGSQSTLVTAGSRTAKLATGHWQLDPADADGAAMVVGDGLAGGPLHGVVSLWALDLAGDPRDRAALDADQAVALQGALHIAQALAGRDDARTRLWFVTRGATSVDGELSSPPQATLWGFARVLAAEQPDLRTTLVDLAPGTVRTSDEVVAELLAGADDDQIAYRGGHRLVARLARAQPEPPLGDGAPYRLDISERGSLDNLVFTPLDPRTPGDGEVQIEVRATGLNFRDVLNVLGMYPGDPGPPGVECAGVVTAVGAGVTSLAVGDSVLGIATNAYDSSVVTPAGLVTRKPAAMTFAEAATVPVAYLTARYGLFDLAGLRAGDRVLIHAATGGVGMAAVHLAQRAGAEIFATAGSADKHAVLRELGVHHIYSSRTLDFAEQIRADTGGAGVDVVLNSLADEFTNRSIDILAPGGRFLEMGKRGIWSHEQFAAARPDAAYFPYDLADLLVGGHARTQHLLHETVDEIAGGALALPPIRSFPAAEISTAFRFMAQARHIGKVVITHRRPGASIRPDATYLLTGGLGGIGLALARWLVVHGARHVVLAGRRAPDADAVAIIDELRAGGADVRAVATDVSNADAVGDLLASVDRELPPLRGIFHAAGVLDDGVIGRQTWERFCDVLAPKAGAAWALHRATRALDLDHFVLFSSAAAVFGSPGQSSYAAANSLLDTLAHRRRSEGLAGLSVDWGAWGEVGMASRLDARARTRIEATGFASLSTDEALATLDALLAAPRAQAVVTRADWEVVRAQLADAPSAALFRDVLAAATSSGRGAPSRDLLAELDDAPADERPELLAAAVRDELVRVLGLDPGEAIDPAQGLSDLGMDSLMAVELSNRLSALVGRSLASTLPFEHPTLNALTGHLTDLLGIGVQEAEAAPSVADAYENLSADELEAALLRELDEAGY